MGFDTSIYINNPYVNIDEVNIINLKRIMKDNPKYRYTFFIDAKNYWVSVEIENYFQDLMDSIGMRYEFKDRYMLGYDYRELINLYKNKGSINKIYDILTLASETQSIALCDVIIFVNGYKKDKRDKIKYNIAKEYNIDIFNYYTTHE